MPQLALVIDGLGPDLIVLAGFMRILTDGFIARYPRRIVNIHPSLLPSFPGLHTHARALGGRREGAWRHGPRRDAGARQRAHRRSRAWCP